MADLVRGKYPAVNPEWLRNGAALIRENVPRWAANANNTAVGTGVMLSASIPLCAGDLITNLSFRSGGTAGATLTNWWFALYDDSATPALLSQSADQTSAAWAANTTKTLALATPQRIQRDGIYWAAFMVAAATVPTLQGITVVTGGAAAAISGQAVLAQTSGSGLTTTAPATIASPTASLLLPYVAAN